MVESLPARLNLAFVEDIAARCQQVFAEGGVGEAAAAMHQQIEALADAAEAQGQGELASAAFELSVFLCSLVESLSPAGAAAQSRITAMCEAMRRAADPERASVEPARKAREPTAPLVLLLLDDGEQQLQLAAEFGSRRLRVDAVQGLEDLARVLGRQAVDVLVFDTHWLERCAEVMQVVERGSTNQLHDPGYVALIPDGDRGRRMFALRAGIDRVVERAGVPAIANEIAAFVQERRHAAYRVLLVEDDRAQAMFVRSVLAHRGIETVIAQRADEALERVVEYRPDLFLLDLHLPDRNGIELAQLLRERPGLDLVPIVFLSGEDNMEEHFRAMRLGGDAWIAKPVKPRHLLAVVEARAERARRLRARGQVPVSSGTRPGLLSRERLVELLSASEAGAGAPRMLLAVAPVEMPDSEQGVDFVAQGRLSEDIARFLASHALGKLGVCQPAPFLSLLVVELEAQAALEALQGLQQALSSFGWLSREFPVQLPFAVGATALDTAGSADGLIRAAQQQLERARNGEDRVQWLSSRLDDEPETWPRLRELFARDTLAGHLRFQFHPLLPIRGRISGQFLLACSLSCLGQIHSIEQLREFARRHGLSQRLEQVLLGQALSLLRERLDAGQDCVFAWQLGAEALNDDSFAAWLRTELTRRRLPSARLNIWVDAEALPGGAAPTQRLLRPLAEAGLRVVVGPLSVERSDLDLLQLSEIDAISCRLQDSESGPRQLPEALLKAAADYGKILIVEAVDSTAELADLFSEAVHYVCGEAVSPPLNSAEFEFPQD